jgi:outer membrane protein
MNEYRSLQITIFIFLAALSFRVFSAETISPGQAISYALEHSPVLQGTASSVRERNEQIKSAKAEKLPVIDLDYGMIYSDNPLVSLGSKMNNRSISAEDFSPDTVNNPGASDNYFGTLRLKLPLYSGGKINAGIDEATAAHASSQAQLKRTTSTVIYQIKRAYLLAQAAYEAIAIARRSATAAARHVKTTRELLLENRTVASDNITAKVYHRSVKGVVSQAETQYEQALNSLKQVMGKDLSADISIVPWQSVSDESALPGISAAESQALNNRHDLNATAESITASEARTRIANSASRLQLGLEANSSLYADNPLVDELSWGVLAVAKINLFSGGANKTRVSASREETYRLQAEKETQELEIQKQVRNAYASINEGKTRIMLARENLSDAQKAVTLVNERYGEGRTILIDLLQSEQSLMKSRSESLNSRLLLEASRLELQLAMDNFSEAKI